MSKWEKVKLSDLGRIVTGNTPSTSNKSYFFREDIPFYKPNDFAEDSVNTLVCSQNFVSENAREVCRIVPINSVMVTCIGIIGKVGISTSECTCNQQINAIIPDQKICNCNYLAYSIWNLRQHLRSIANAPVVPIINKSQFSEVQIYLPPLDVQKQIADTLDKASRLIELRKTQLDKMDLLIKSKFIEMFGDPVTNPKQWVSGTIRDVVSDVKYGTSKPANEEGKYIYLRMGNITYDGRLDLSDIKHIDMSDLELDKYQVKKDDILFNRTNSKELVGKTCVFKEDNPMIIAGYIIRIRTNELANSEYVSAVLNSKYGKSTLFEMCKAIVGQANINAQEVQSIRILIPPISIQKEYAEFVEEVDAKRNVLLRGLELLDNQYKALMQEYFN